MILDFIHIVHFLDNMLDIIDLKFSFENDQQNILPEGFEKDQQTFCHKVWLNMRCRAVNLAVHSGTDGSNIIQAQKNLNTIKIRTVDYRDKQPDRPLNTAAKHPAFGNIPVYHPTVNSTWLGLSVFFVKSK